MIAAAARPAGRCDDTRILWRPYWHLSRMQRRSGL